MKIGKMLIFFNVLKILLLCFTQLCYHVSFIESHVTLNKCNWRFSTSVVFCWLIGSFFLLVTDFGCRVMGPEECLFSFCKSLFLMAFLI